MPISTAFSIPNDEKNINSLKEIICNTGEILVDRRANGKDRPWAVYRTLAIALYKIYGIALDRDPFCISQSAYTALSRCSSWLLFRSYAGGVKKLERAEFCRNRLCPTCNWRKSMKLYGQMQKVSKELMATFPTARFLFLTLTVKNVEGSELAKTIDAMNAGFKLLVNAGKNNASAKPIKKNLLGYAKAMEIKYDSEEFITEQMYRDRKKYYDKLGVKAGNRNPNYDKYHPHFHVLLMVKGEFFRTGYIKQSKWTSIWQDCMKLGYVPQVDVRVIKPNQKRAQDGDLEQEAMSSAISETMKYPIKPDSLKLSEFDKMPEKKKNRVVDAVICLSYALKGRRLVTFGGEILKARKKLNQDDVETGDLIGVDGEPVPETDFELILYKWRVGCYVCS